MDTIDLAVRAIDSRIDTLGFLASNEQMALGWDQADDLKRAAQGRLDALQDEYLVARQLQQKLVRIGEVVGNTGSHLFVRLGSEVVSINRASGKHREVSLADAETAIQVDAVLA